METTKEILAELFGARPSDVEEMIRLRLEERSWSEEGGGRRGSARESKHHSLWILDPGLLSLAGSGGKEVPQATV